MSNTDKMTDIFVAKKEADLPKASEATEYKPVGFFSSYVENPKNISFHHRDEDENILLFLRGHFIINLKWLLIALGFALLPGLFFSFGISSLPFPAIPGKFTTVFVLTYYLLLLGYIFSHLLTWFFNIFIVTKKRVIDIDFAGLIFHDVAETQFTLLQDVNYTQSGPLRHLLNYGDVFAQTAGGKENLEAMGVPKPAHVAKFIVQHIGKGRGSV